MPPARTASRPCRILLIDGKLVVAAPGRHGPVHDSRIRGQVNLSGGPHEFQYLHAAAGANACMVAAAASGSAKPEPIPPEAFGSEAIGQYPAIGVKHLHEYSVDIAGEVPLAGSDLPLVRVQFRSVSTRVSAARPKIHWDFGDGQTSTLTDPLHIYLLPGLYTVTMKVSGESDHWQPPTGCRFTAPWSSPTRIIRQTSLSLLPWHRRSSYEPDAPARGVPQSPRCASG